jgi:hypothetical protein
VAVDGQWRFPPSIEGVNEKFAAALIEFEDKRFRFHPGVDPLATPSWNGSGKRAALTGKPWNWPGRSPFPTSPSPCPYCVTVTINREATVRISLGPGSSEQARSVKWFVLPPAEEWYYRRWNFDYRPLPPQELNLTHNSMTDYMFQEFLTAKSRGRPLSRSIKRE